MSAPAVEASGVGRTFPDGTVALRDAAFAAPAGKITVLVGPSGCGKTTMLRIIGGLDAPTAGEVRVGGAPASAAGVSHGADAAARGNASAGGLAARVAFAFQEPRLLPWRTVLSNVALPLELAGVPRGERLDRAREALRLVCLPDAERKLPGHLSGGMRMRASIARALVTRPSLLLLDEPFGALDEITRNLLDDMLLGLNASLGMTVLLVTHSITEATYLGDRVVVMAPAPGRTVRTFDPAFASRTPALRATAEFAACAADILRALGEASVRAGAAA